MRKILFFVLCFSFSICAAVDSICFATEIDVFKLAEKGTPKQLKAALKAGAKFNVERNISDFDNYSEVDDEYWPFDMGETPLHRAAFYNRNPKSIKFLIAQGLDVNATAEVGLYASLKETRKGRGRNNSPRSGTSDEIRHRVLKDSGRRLLEMSSVVSACLLSLRYAVCP